MKAINPYQSPVEVLPNDDTIESRDASTWLLIAWPLVLGLNVVVPALLALLMTERHGRLGMVIAFSVFLFGGCVFCRASALYGRRLVAGAAFFAVTQFFPIIQIIAGAITIRFALAVDLAREERSDKLVQISSEMGGFIVTMIVGTILLAFAAGIGWGFGLLGRDRAKRLSGP